MGGARLPPQHSRKERLAGLETSNMSKNERTARKVCSQEEAAQRRRNRVWMHRMIDVVQCGSV